MVDHIIQMKNVRDISFPKLVFSPLATSSPRNAKINQQGSRKNESWHSTSTDSSGNVTGRAIDGVDESVLMDEETSKLHKSDNSMCSIRTALEYVDTGVLKKYSSKEFIARYDLRKAILAQKYKEVQDELEAELYSVVSSERILWNSGRLWYGTVPVDNSKEALESYAEYATTNIYMQRTAMLCDYELSLIDNNYNFCYDSVVRYCKSKGIPTIIVDRIFQRNLVRQTDTNELDINEAVHLIFAINGMDDIQSIEYWFRILDVDGDGVLCFRHLKTFYDQITRVLAEQVVTALTFQDVCTQYCDILESSSWTLADFKKHRKLSPRVIKAFVSASMFLADESDERTNQKRVDDENFGVDHRSDWERELDHAYDDFYRTDDSSSYFETY